MPFCRRLCPLLSDPSPVCFHMDWKGFHPIFSHATRPLEEAIVDPPPPRDPQQHLPENPFGLLLHPSLVSPMRTTIVYLPPANHIV